MSLRCGITTGTCAAAAAKAAAMALTQCGEGGPCAGLREDCPLPMEVTLPNRQTLRVPVLFVEVKENGTAATAAVCKDAGDDPDVTHGLTIRATVSWDDTVDVHLVAGEGVGIVTKPGLQVPPGQPAINPVPRRMIAAAVREVAKRGVRVEIAIPGGREIAARTYNPRLGIEGGLSILGTTGIVRPYCIRACREALRCSLDVAAACGVGHLVLVPGNIGARAAHALFALDDQQTVEVGNEWGGVVDLLPEYSFQAVLLVGHPGKLVKLAAGQWDTHSSRSSPVVNDLGRACTTILGQPAPDTPTAEGLFAALAPVDQRKLGDHLAGQVQQAVRGRLAIGRSGKSAEQPSVSVVLVNMAGTCLGTAGELAPWQ